jgi:(p)ppGpp synthase/HD superfamily hydrolase
MNLVEISKNYAYKCHQDTNHFYGDKPYSFHLDMVVSVEFRFIHLIPEPKRDIVISAGYCHDTFEDCRQTYNDIKKATNEEIADIVYAVSN